MIIQKDECRMKLNKRTYIRSSMLELSKVLIHYFHYKYINKNDDKADSLLYEIQTENFYKDKDLFDFINYWKVSNYYMIRQIAYSLVKWKVKHTVCP